MKIFVVLIGVGKEVEDGDFVLEGLVFSFSIVPVHHEFYVVLHGEV